VNEERWVRHLIDACHEVRERVRQSHLPADRDLLATVNELCGQLEKRLSHFKTRSVS